MPELDTLILDINTLGQLYKNKVVSPTDVIKEIYRRIEKNGDKSAWTYLISEAEALRYAEENLPLKKEAELPLYGIPFCVKDNIHVKGLATTASCPGYRFFPEYSATVVDKLIDAGAILIGKNTMDQFATGLVGIRSPVHPVNPFNKDYIPGGSSSGSAVAVSTGMVSFALGSDTGGSGRVPAALNNIVGFKPTPGLVSSHGMIYANRSFDCIPIFALTCQDVKKVFDIIVGYDEKDAFSYQQKEAIRQSFFVDNKIKIGIPAKKFLNFFGDKQAQNSFNHALELAEELGGEVIEIDFSLFIEAGKMLFDGPLIAERLASLEIILSSEPENLDPTVVGLVQKAKGYSAVDLCKAYYRLKDIKQQITHLFKSMDIMMVPTTGTIYKIDAVKKDPVNLNATMGYYTYYANILKLSALAVPAAIRDDGLPFGVCFVAEQDDDIALMHLGEKWQQLTKLSLGAYNNI